MTVASDSYRALQQHLDGMPVGYPATESGVEIRLLEEMFTPQQAELATHLDYKHLTVDEVFVGAKAVVGSAEELAQILEEMVGRGAIKRRVRDGIAEYALLPLVLWGMFEHRLKMLTPEYLGNLGTYMAGEFGADQATSALPRSRYIPIEESVDADLRIATYDELRHLIEQAGDRLTVQECICRKINDLMGKPCQATDRREVCLSFGDLADLYAEQGWGRRITPDEALEIALQGEREGLVLMPGNNQESTFMCSCCEDCCAMLNAYKYMPSPADAVATNFQAQVDVELCTGTAACIELCPTDAIVLQDEVAVISLNRCIGCGLCVPACPEKAMRLVNKAGERIPPETEEELYDILLAGRQALRG